MRATRATWTKRVEQWERSGLSGADFAARMGVKEATLRHWKWQLGHDERGEAKKATFIEVTASNSAPAFEVLVGEVRVIVPVGFDEDTLGRLLRVVAGSR